MTILIAASITEGHGLFPGHLVAQLQTHIATAIFGGNLMSPSLQGLLTHVGPPTVFCTGESDPTFLSCPLELQPGIRGTP